MHKLAVTIVDPLSLYQADGGAKGATDLEGGSCLSFSQHGSQQGRSMTTNLLEYLEKLAEILDKGDSFDIIYLDFVRHLMLFSESLLRKLEGWVWWTRC